MSHYCCEKVRAKEICREISNCRVFLYCILGTAQELFQLSFSFSNLAGCNNSLCQLHCQFFITSDVCGEFGEQQWEEMGVQSPKYEC